METIGLIFAFGLGMTYVNFLLKESYIFSKLRIKFETWLKKQKVQGKEWPWSLWECNLCNNFWITLFACLIFTFPVYLALTTPIMAAIIKKNAF